MPIILPAIVRWQLLLDGHRGGVDRERIGVRRGVARPEGGGLHALALTPHEVIGVLGPLRGVHLDAAVLLSLGALVNALQDPLMRRSENLDAGELDAERTILDVLLASGEAVLRNALPVPSLELLDRAVSARRREAVDVVSAVALGDSVDGHHDLVADLQRHWFCHGQSFLLSFAIISHSLTSDPA